MWKSEPIPMIQGGRQLASIDMAMCYAYSKNGRHVSSIELNGDVLCSVVSVYGIGINGSSNKLGSFDMITNSSYLSDDYASCLCRGLKIKEYPFICWTIDDSISDTCEILSDGVMIMESREYSDNPSENNTHNNFII